MYLTRKYVCINTTQYILCTVAKLSVWLLSVFLEKKHTHCLLCRECASVKLIPVWDWHLGRVRLTKLSCRIKFLGYPRKAFH